MRFSLSVAFVAGLAAQAYALTPITVKGNAFFAGNDRFYIRGVGKSLFQVVLALLSFNSMATNLGPLADMIKQITNPVDLPSSRTHCPMSIFVPETSRT